MKKLLFLTLLSMCVIINFSYAQNTDNKDKGKGKDKGKNGKEIQVTPASSNKGNTDKGNAGKGNTGTTTSTGTTNAVQPVVTPQTGNAVTPQVTQDTSATKKPTGNDKKPEVNMTDITSGTRPIVTQSENGSVNWTEQYIEAKGYSVIDTVKFPNKGQAKAMAIRGAVVVAQRNLLEIIKGVNVTSETTVKDMITEGDYIYTRVDGVIKGAEMVGDAIEKDGMIEIKMRVPLYTRKGLATALYDNVPDAEKKMPLSPAAQEVNAQLQEQNLNGLAFNIGGKTIDPALFPLIVDESGNLVFDFKKLLNQGTGDFPKIFNATDNFFKEVGFNKGVELLDVVRTEPGKIVLNNNNIKKVNWGKVAKTAGAIGKFLMMFI